ncbi:hypothetical protein EKK58_05355 [Candidatus Dependentiae bacterium]|nr:MAG: hypothetical protein EKK58_05355 [Candidatus Dependentiae bacterium]
MTNVMTKQDVRPRAMLTEHVEIFADSIVRHYESVAPECDATLCSACMPHEFETVLYIEQDGHATVVTFAGSNSTYSADEAAVELALTREQFIERAFEANPDLDWEPKPTWLLAG